MSESRRSVWNENLPAILILGSPAVAVAMAHTVALVGHFVLPDMDWVTVGGALMLRLNFLLAAAGSAAGALRVGGTLSTRIAALIASATFALAVYAGVIAVTFTFIPGYANRFGID